MSSELHILLDEGPCLVVNKPHGLLTQAPPGIDCLENSVRDYWRQREGRQGKIYVGVPHRLDRPVTGAVIFTRHIRATQRISRQFEERTLEKYYLGVVSGSVPDEQGTLTHWLKKVPDRAYVQVTQPEDPQARVAILDYRVMARWRDVALLMLRPRTGRMHQIRVQLSHVGCPISGDTQYGAVRSWGPVLSDPRQRPIALHARLIDFRHPTLTGRRRVWAPVPENWWHEIPLDEQALRDLESQMSLG